MHNGVRGVSELGHAGNWLSVAFDTALITVADATRKKRKLYTRPCGWLDGAWEKVECILNTTVGLFSQVFIKGEHFALRALERLRVEEA